MYFKASENSSTNREESRSKSVFYCSQIKRSICRKKNVLLLLSKVTYSHFKHSSITLNSHFKCATIKVKEKNIFINSLTFKHQDCVGVALSDLIDSGLAT